MTKLERWVVGGERWVAMLGRWVAKLKRWVTKLQRWVLCGDIHTQIRRWVCK